MNAILFAGAVLVCVVEITAQSMNRIVLHGQELFINGMNVAWDRYSNDVGDQEIDEAGFREMIANMAEAGGNSMRWWLSTNGANDPKFGSDGLVSGLGSQTITNIRKVLDIAEEHKVVIMLCLLSFDLMQSSQWRVNVDNNEKMLITDEGMKAYIDKALIPLVTAIGNHPAILCWEIFNEPEGMVHDVEWAGWAAESRRISIRDVQKFINRTAGAIHRAVPGVFVSNGSWSAKASTDLPGNHNYYTDEELIAAGGDPDGTLDFYQIHYYPEHFGEAYSPFHHPVSHWGLDKPVIIGEFPAYGILAWGQNFLPSTELTITEAYNHLYDNGYAGGLSWTYSGFRGGDFNTTRPALEDLAEKHPDDILIKDMTDVYLDGNAALSFLPQSGTGNPVFMYAEMTVGFRRNFDSWEKVFNAKGRLLSGHGDR